MANFNTHLVVATTGSTGLALLAANNHLISQFEVPWLIFMGAVGGMLPDIDSDNTKQVKWVFSLLATVCAFALLSQDQSLYPFDALNLTHGNFCQIKPHQFLYLLSLSSDQCVPYNIVIFSLISFVLIRYVLLAVFKSLTVHRGVFHSILAAVFFTLLVTCLSHHLLQQDSLFAWLNGLFIGIGFIIHLLLDEVYSVDLANSRFKRSFGTAFKLFNYRDIYASLFMFLCTAGLYLLTPSPSPVINALHQANQSTPYISLESLSVLRKQVTFE